MKEIGVNRLVEIFLKKAPLVNCFQFKILNKWRSIIDYVRIKFSNLIIKYEISRSICILGLSLYGGIFVFFGKVML